MFLFTKWELVEENKLMTEVTYGLLLPRGFNERCVHVDVYRKKKLNGIYKYKNVIREN